MTRGLDVCFGLRCSAISIPLFVGSVACNMNKEEPPENVVSDERALLEPAEQSGNYSRRCRGVPGTKPVTLRASSHQGTRRPVEVGGVSASESGYVLGVLRTEADTSAEIVFLDGRGASKITKLGRVHGSVEPPQVAMVGDDAVVALVDNDAGHTRLRLAKVASVARDAHVTWGPEIQVRRGETQSFSLASAQKTAGNAPHRALLAWDDFDKSKLRSSVRALLIDHQSMQAVGSEYQLSPADEDAVSPIVVSGGAGSAPFFSVWLAYGEVKAKPAPTNALVEEPPRTLRVQLLDSAGKPQGYPLQVSRMGANVLVYDARALRDGGLMVAYREADSGGHEGASPVHVAVVGEDGSIQSQTASHEDLGLGAPVLLETAHPGALWLSARARESEALLGLARSSAEVRDFELEWELRDRMPLAAFQDRFLVMEPDGLDLRLSTLLCAAKSQEF